MFDQKKAKSSSTSSEIALSTHEWLLEIAQCSRRVIWEFLVLHAVYLMFGLFDVFVFNQGHQPLKAFVVFVVCAYVVFWVCFVVDVARLSELVCHRSTRVCSVFFALCMVPLLQVLPFLVLVMKSTSILNRHGIRAGLLGVDLRQFH